jgi:hypothetical protein
MEKAVTKNGRGYEVKGVKKRRISSPFYVV